VTGDAPGGRSPLLPVFRSPRLTILLVDTDDRARRATKRALEAEGFRVIEARGGGQALRLCEYTVGRVDVLITEVAIASPNGVALAEAVTAWWPAAVVLLLSDSVVGAITLPGARSGTRRVVRRPLAPEALVEATLQALVAR
jgi:DNA-binding response OmpR family regulator